MNRYRTIKQIGAGSAGAVYLVEDGLRGGARVALKRISAQADDLLKSSIEQEFSVLSRLSLPRVARVFDFGVLPATKEDPGGPFFTRTYIDGSPLDTAVKSAELSGRLAAFCDAAQTVAAVHRAGVIHGDIKPSNLIVDRHRHVHLIDFGLARQVRGLSELTGTEGGTPLFMAPELLLGESPSLRSDVYALGATLWMLVAGRPPFAELGVRSTSTKLKQHAPELPPTAKDTEALVLEVAQRALMANPAERFPSVDELCAAMGRFFTETAPESRSVFHLPIPHGQETWLSMLDAQLRSSSSGARGNTSTIVVVAPEGGGKTTLLRQLRFRLQLRGLTVVELSVQQDDGLSPLSSLLGQCAVLAAEDQLARVAVERLRDQIRSPKPPEPHAIAETATRALSAVAKQESVVILADDLDRAESSVGAVLRMIAHGDPALPISVVATTRDLKQSAVRELGGSEIVRLGALSRADLASITRTVIGSVDDSVVEALYVRSDGTPGVLIDLLQQLSSEVAITADDVARLSSSASTLLRTAREKLALVTDSARTLLEVLSVSFGRLPKRVLPELGAGSKIVIEEALSFCESIGLLSRDLDCLVIDPCTREVVLSDLGPDGVRKLARELMMKPAASGLPKETLARLAIAAQDEMQIRTHVPDAARALDAAGATRAAASFYRAWIEHCPSEDSFDAVMALSRIQHTLGDYREALRLAGNASESDHVSDSQRTIATIAAARAYTAMGDYDAAIVALDKAAERKNEVCAPQIYRELAKIHLRQGDYLSVEKAVRDGLQSAAENDPTRIELLTSLGMAHSYRGNHERARSLYEQALFISRANGLLRDEANILTYLAIDRHRSGQLEGARELYARSLEIARGLGDLGSMATFSLNLGAILFALGDLIRASEQYEQAVRLARRAGRASTDLVARNNLANLHLYLGRYERGKQEAYEALHDAEQAGMKPAAAQAMALLGDVAIRVGDLQEGLRRYDDAIARYRELGQSREVAEVQLDAAEACVDEARKMKDPHAAASYLAEARNIVEMEHLEDFRLRLRFLSALVRGEAGELDVAVEEIEEVAKQARSIGERDLEWRAFAAAGRLHAARGSEFLARRNDQLAVETLESIASVLHAEARESFWQDPRRQAIRRRAVAPARVEAKDLSSGQAVLETRTARLLEIIKRLASEHNLERLLDRITESAVDLFGAERGLLLLPNPDGVLEPRTVRDFAAADPHVSFSRSIAEAVLIDGEPLVTVNATDDRRLQEYLSVHQLMLRSVACLPIRGRVSVLGVLYLEHRMRAGRFDEGDVDMMLAFADQAAIALENAKLIEENNRRREELERANRALEAAKDDIERLLFARERELEETAQQLQLARRELSATHDKHGIIGSTEAMRRVHSLIERVREASVPVVIRGESGTGKELVARAIHYSGTRAKGPFVVLNCAAIPESLMESELFGHVRGAFTGADKDRKGVLMQATGGTLFLDEVGDMPAKMQVDLLRVLQEGKVRPVGAEEEDRIDVRFVAASNKPLDRLVSQGLFREDLYYRLHVVEITLPPLRERIEDIPLLCNHFLARFAERYGKSKKQLSRQAMQRLISHPLPGNVRQLEHTLLNAYVLVTGDTIAAEDLHLPSEGAEVLRPFAPQNTVSETSATLHAHKESERQRILSALSACGWNRARAAESLGMPRRTFYRRLREYGVL